MCKVTAEILTFAGLGNGAGERPRKFRCAIDGGKVDLITDTDLIFWHWRSLVGQQRHPQRGYAQKEENNLGPLVSSMIDRSSIVIRRFLLRNPRSALWSQIERSDCRRCGSTTLCLCAVHHHQHHQLLLDSGCKIPRSAWCLASAVHSVLCACLESALPPLRFSACLRRVRIVWERKKRILRGRSISSTPD